MRKKLTFLGIETSCDETAVSIIQYNESGIPKILSNIISSQFDIHKEFGGVVPELAARSHVEKINLIAKKYKFEYVVHGDDWKKGPQALSRKKLIQTMRLWNGKVIDLPYTKKISSSLLKKKIKNV